MEIKRIFIGIPVKVSLETILVMIQTTIDTPFGDIKWVYGKNLHLTLSFLGNLEQIKIDELKKLFETIKFGLPFNCVLTYTGIFPNQEEPRVFWLGVEKGKDRIIEIVEQIDGILENLNLSLSEKPYIPHVTIGRMKNKENAWKIDTNTYLNAVFSPIIFPFPDAIL